MPSEKSINFVNYISRLIHTDKDKGFRAKMRKADNENIEYQSWDILSRWVDLEWDANRRAFALIGASVARSSFSEDGNLSIGSALRNIHLRTKDVGDLGTSSSAQRLRRILACHEKVELIDILRPVLRLLESSEINISRARLLDEILWFDHEERRDRIRVRWAQDFFKHREES